MKPSEKDRLVRIISRKFINSGMDEEDLCQEGMLALMRAESTFKESVDVKFETYASRVITNRFIDITRKSQRQRAAGPTHFASEEPESDFSLDDQVNLIEIKNILRDYVTELDRAIFNSYIQGFSYEEISKIFELPRKKIDNTVQKVKKIIKALV